MAVVAITKRLGIACRRDNVRLYAGIEVNDSQDHRFLRMGCSGKIDQAVWVQVLMNLASRSDRELLLAG